LSDRNSLKHFFVFLYAFHIFLVSGVRNFKFGTGR